MQYKLYTVLLLSITLYTSCKQKDKEETNEAVTGKTDSLTNINSAAQSQPASNAVNPFVANQPVVQQVVTPQANQVIVSPQTVSTPTTGAPQPVQLTPQQIQQLQQAQRAQQVVANTQTAAPQTVAAGMNPPHGQPGHRCDISVGAPLNSKPAATQPAEQPTIIKQPQTVTMNPTTPVAPGMNPAHGEPGHRCDIAVGAPLNSKPATPGVTTTPQVVSTQTLKPDSSKQRP